MPRDHYGDQQRHKHELTFDFTSFDGAFYMIFAARANEGLEQLGEIEVWVRDVRVWRG